MTVMHILLRFLLGRLPSTMGDFSDFTPAEPGVGHGGLGPLPRLWRAAGAVAPVALVAAVAICGFPLSIWVNYNDLTTSEPWKS